jgi:hypothetical protein
MTTDVGSRQEVRHSLGVASPRMLMPETVELEVFGG